MIRGGLGKQWIIPVAIQQMNVKIFITQFRNQILVSKFGRIVVVYGQYHQKYIKYISLRNVYGGE